MPSVPVLRGADQRTVAALAALGLAFAAAWWLVQGWPGIGLVDIDQAAPIAVQYQVDVNQADWPELLLLPGIGPTLAQRIVDRRIQRGGYQTLGDLTEVAGIGPKTLEKITPYLVVDGRDEMP